MNDCREKSILNICLLVLISGLLFCFSNLISNIFFNINNSKNSQNLINQKSCTNLNTLRGAQKIVTINNETDFLDKLASDKISDSNNIFRLSKDLNFYGYSFSAIGTKDKPFCAVLDGNGFTLENICLKENTYSIFENLKNATIKNLLIINTTTFSNNSSKAMICNFSENSTFENIGIYNRNRLETTNCDYLFNSSVNDNFKNICVELSLSSLTQTVGFVEYSINSIFANISFYNKSNTLTTFCKTSENLSIYNCFYISNNNIFVSNMFEFIKSQNFESLQDISAFRFNALINGGRIPFLLTVKPFLQTEKPDYYVKQLPNISNASISDLTKVLNIKETLSNYLDLSFYEYSPVLDLCNDVLDRIENVNFTFNSVCETIANIEDNILIFNYAPLLTSINNLSSKTLNLTSEQLENFRSIEKTITIFVDSKIEYEKIKYELLANNSIAFDANLLNSSFLDLKTLQENCPFVGADLTLIQKLNSIIDRYADKIIRNICPNISIATISEIECLQKDLAYVLDISTHELFKTKLSSLSNDISLKLKELTPMASNIKILDENYLKIDSCIIIDSNLINSLITSYDKIKFSELLTSDILTSINTKISQLNSIKVFNENYMKTAKALTTILKFAITSTNDFYIIEETSLLINKFSELTDFQLLTAKDKIKINSAISSLDTKLNSLINSKNVILLENTIKHDDNFPINDPSDADTIPNNVSKIFIGKSSTIATFNILTFLIFLITITFFMFKMTKKEHDK